MTSPLIFDLELSELTKSVETWGFESYRAKQIWHAIYQQKIQKPAEMSTIPKTLREVLETEFSFQSLELIHLAHSKDLRTVKALFQISPGINIEAVLMKYKHRSTACISSQSGCGMGCPFCATGKLGFLAQLSSGQIIEQVLYFARDLKETDHDISNIVLMGMGEPFHNYEATMGALDRLNDPTSCSYGARRITVSTVGIIPGIERFTREGRRENLAVSLHAANNPLRNDLVPINKKYPLEDLMVASKAYVNSSHRRISFEWALIDGVNDRLDHAKELIRLVDGLLCHINLIPLNPIPAYRRAPSSQQRAKSFCNYLQSQGIPCTIRISRGVDIRAGCGQLAAEYTA